MRRIMLLALGALALALAVPGVASAHGRHHRHRHHHAKAHHARTEHFGGSASTSPSNPGSPGDAGRVASFANGVLTITLADGSSVSGNVTSDTEIGCMGAGATASRDGGSGDRGGESDQGDHGDRGDDQGAGDDQGDQRDRSPSCGTAQLVPGAAVHEAILKLGPGGAEFKLVLLDEQQAAS